MAKKVRSARGVIVDFDLLKIKQQIADAPAAVDVAARETFVEKRLRRRGKRSSPATVKPLADSVEQLDETEFEQESDDSADLALDETTNTESKIKPTRKQTNA